MRGFLEQPAPPDIRHANREAREVARSLRTSGGVQRGPETSSARKIKPAGVRVMPGSVNTGALISNLPPFTALVRMLPQNSNRRRLVIPNPDIMAQSIYVAFGNGLGTHMWRQIASGEDFDENGTTSITEEIWVATSVANSIVGYYEGTEDAQS